MNAHQKKSDLLLILTVIFSFIVSLAWYFIGTYLNTHSSDGGICPTSWGIPIVAIITFTFTYAILKKLKVSIKYNFLNNRSQIIVLIVTLSAIVTLFLTRYKIVNTGTGAIYKIDRWTGSTYLIVGTSEKKVFRR